jgi:uncharacterized membrane protein YbhN (UPF0104 family)
MRLRSLLPESKKAVLRYIVVLLLTGFFIYILTRSFDVSKLSTYLLKVPPRTLLAAFSLVVLNMLFSSMRYHILLRRLGVKQPLMKSFHDNILSIFGGAVAFSFFGQGLFRAAMNGKADWAPSMAFLTTGIERGATLIVLLILSVSGVAWLFGGPTLNFAHFQYQFMTIIYLAVATGAVFMLGLRPKDRKLCHQILQNHYFLLLEMIVVTLFMLVSMGLAYVTIAASLSQNANLFDLSAMASIVMFISSLPISFSGWGIRELSASYVFNTIGQSPEAGLSMGILIGLLSLIAIFCLALFFTFLRKHNNKIVDEAINKPDTAPVGLMGAMFWFLPLAACVAVLFQVRLPTGSGMVNINLADPLVITGALIALFHLVKNKCWGNLFWAPRLTLALLLVSLVILGGFIHSWVSYGIVIDWALYNRLIGWLVLMAYLLTGFMIQLRGGLTGVQLIYRSYLIACAGIVVVNVVYLLVANFPGIHLDKFWIYSGLIGMSGNPNAFGFQLLIALVIGLSGRPVFNHRKTFAMDNLILGIVVAGIYLTQSRASMVTLICVLVLYLWLKIPLKTYAAVLFVAVCIIGGFYLILGLTSDIHVALPFVGGGGSGGGIHVFRFNSMAMITDVQSDRLLSFTEGFKMWRHHLLLGAGLGAFIYEQIQSTGVPLVVHCIYLWWLAEFGLFGFLSFLTIPVSVLVPAWKGQTKVPKWAVHSALGILSVMAICGLVHDMVYQRVFWFFLGVVAANTAFFDQRARLSKFQSIAA